jgi:hypothetical protein
VINSRNDRNEWESLPIQHQLDDHRKRMDELESRRKQLLTEWQKANDSIHDTKNALNNRKPKKNDSDLIKPNRGFIMYGPPGKCF